MAMNYELLTVETAGAYIASRPDLAALVDVATLAVTEVGDGNLNLVFICQDGAGKGLVLKQSLPYVRVAPDWPMTPERATAEARGLGAAAEYAPTTSPIFYGYDHSRYVLAMQDLSHLTIWRNELNEARAHVDAADLAGAHIARLVAGTGLMTHSPETLREERGRIPNTALCDITEQLVFTEPYIDHENNAWPPAITPLVHELRDDVDHRLAVDRMKTRFITSCESLVHGDLHTGSVMVGQDLTGNPDARVIDAEFCFYGPTAFDLGALFGNYLAAAVRAEALGQAEHLAAVQTLPGRTWQAFETTLRSLWPDRTGTLLHDAYIDPWLVSLRQDAIAYGACKATRRMVGFAKVSDMETLPADLHVEAVTTVLQRARGWMRAAHDLAPDELLTAGT